MAELNLDEIAALARAAAERADKATGMDAEGYAFQASSVDVPALAADVTALVAEVKRLRGLLTYRNGGVKFCSYCDVLMEGEHMEHKPECPVVTK